MPASSSASGSQSSTAHLTNNSVHQGSQSNDSTAVSSAHKPVCPVECKACAEWRCTGQAVLGWFDGFLSGVVGVGTLGAGFTFSVVFSSLEGQDTRNKPVDTNLVRHFLIIAWLLFVLAVALASICSALLRFCPKGVVEGFNRHLGVVNILASGASIVLQLLVVAAFLMSARALRRYDESSGRAAVVIVSAVGCLLAAIWVVVSGLHIFGKNRENSANGGHGGGRVQADPS